MVKLVLTLLGVDYLRKRWKAICIAGWLWGIAGVVIFLLMRWITPSIFRSISLPPY